MKVFCCSYETTYGRLAAVLGKSVRRHCPQAGWDHGAMRPAAAVSGVPQHATINTGKLWKWNAVVQQADEDVICVDADMVCLKDLTPAFYDDFDFGYTVRPGLKRYQGGAVYVRNTPAAKAFMQEWAETNDALLDNAGELDDLIARFGGANQAALGVLMGEDGPGASELVSYRAEGYIHPGQIYGSLIWKRGDIVMKAMPCEVWNSCSQTWGTFGPETRLLHMTGRLRRAILEGRRPDPAGPYGDMIPMVDAWLEEAR